MCLKYFSKFLRLSQVLHCKDKFASNSKFKKYLSYKFKPFKYFLVLFQNWFLVKTNPIHKLKIKGNLEQICLKYFIWSTFFYSK